MSQLYARIFLRILDSSIADDWKTRLVFQDALLMANQGVLDITREAWSRKTNVPIDVVNEAIAALESPDKKSRDPEDDGRRLIRLDGHRDWGWMIVNWVKYEAIRNSSEERAQIRERVRRYRQRHQSLPLPSPSPTTSSASASASASETPLHERYHSLPSVTCNGSNDVTALPVGLAPDDVQVGESRTCPGHVPDNLLPLDYEQVGIKGHPKSWYPATDARAILGFLNETAGRHFREVDASLSFIEARLAEDGVTVDGVKTMILRQWKKWKGTDMEDYMRPATLFNATKFEAYYAAKDLPIHANHSQTAESNPRNSGCAPNTTDYAALARQLGPKRPVQSVVEEVDRPGHPALGNAAPPPV